MNKLKILLLGGTASMAMLSACNNSENKQKPSDMSIHQHAKEESTYACPMHPEVTGKKGEKCSKCGMELKPLASEKDRNFEVKLTSNPEVIQAGTPVKLSIAITEEGKSVTMDVVHEMKMHLLVMNEELTWFDHIHPEEQTDGTYNISETFPGGGKYLLFTDYKPLGASGNVKMQVVEVKGAPLNVPKITTEKLISKVDNYTVTLTNGNDLKTGGGQVLTFTVEKDGKKLEEKDIQSYLGANAHIVMVAKETKDFLHIHPMSDPDFPIYAETQVKKAGLYRMWVQFKINDKVHTADFTVNVVEGTESASENPHHHNH
ncbi:heavy metal-binding domain-containing protein [Flavobacterium sp. '19STA2R22 D10 B1']|uniref:heavy metal-binding domain-containing protein n=1 Tax=Flavobacterium aerium TaxID=3037261 RepID=UPI00278BEF64|nr:heavy metal-binding domain-containing protein [Flavobacterium sp. '19STA2R22 D10 B1']